MPRVLVTRTHDQSGPLAEALRRVGLEPVVVPAIAVEIEPPGGPLDAAARALNTFDWVVVTSPNGARAVLTVAERLFTPLETPRWAAVGDATASVLEREGIEIAFRPSRAAALALADELPIYPGGEVLVLRGDRAGGDLPRRLRQRGARVTDVVAYRTIEAPPTSRPALRAALAGEPPAAVLFASGSAARGLVALAELERLEVTSLPAICIGSVSAREAVRLGFDVVGTSSAPDPSAFASTAAAVLAQPLETR